MDAELIANISAGFSAVLFSPLAWLIILLGVVLGMIVGILPGFGPPAAMALLFPIVYVLEPLQAVSLLAGIFYGAKYGGAVTSIIMGIPGETDAVATLLEGYPLCRAGKAKLALMLATISSFIGGMLATLGLVLLAPILTFLALFLGPAGRFALIVASLVLISTLGQGKPLKNFCMVFLGLTLALIGLDPIYGSSRLVFGSWRLFGGVDLTAMLLGCFGLGEILSILVLQPMTTTPHAVTEKIATNVPPLRKGAAFGAALRGTILGFGVGLVPSGAGMTASFASYALEKKLSPNPEYFGKGAWTGLAGPEASNNAVAIAAFAPLLLLGLPTNPVMAALLGSLTVSGVVPGPFLPSQQPMFYWGFIISLVIGNIALLGLGLALAGVWAKLATLEYRVIWPPVLILCLLGSYLSTNGLDGSFQCLLFGLGTVFLRRSGFSPAPMVLAFVLGPSLEVYFMQGLLSGF